tara:strand:+ start:7328 stop:8359 length:1032 start_codon:yes stop_codon:yes gene_type:complete
MKSLRIIHWAVAAVILISSGLSVAQAKTFRLSSETSDTTSRTQAGIRFAENLEKASDGMMKVRVFPNAQLTGGDQLKQAELVGRGALDFMVTSAITVSPLVPKMSVFSLPYLYTGYEDVDATVNGAPGERMNEIMAEHGIVVLAWGESGFREITNAARPIKSPEDIKGLKMRVAGPMFIDIMTELGANPQQMQWTETFSALQQGVVDGQENPIGAVIIPQRVYEVQKYITTWHYSYDPAFLAVSKKLWDSLDADEQQIMKAAAESAMDWQKEDTRLQTARGINFLKENGMEVYNPSKDEIAAFRDATKQSFEKWSARVGEDLVSLFQKTIEKNKNTMGSDGAQ